MSYIEVAYQTRQPNFLPVLQSRLKLTSGKVGSPEERKCSGEDRLIGGANARSQRTPTKLGFAGVRWIVFGPDNAKTACDGSIARCFYFYVYCSIVIVSVCLP